MIPYILVEVWRAFLVKHICSYIIFMMVMRIKIKQIFNKNYIFILNNENINK